MSESKFDAEQALPESEWIDLVTKLCMAYRSEGIAAGLALELVAVIRGMIQAERKDAWEAKAAEHAKEIDVLQLQIKHLRERGTFCPDCRDKVQGHGCQRCKAQKFEAEVADLRRACEEKQEGLDSEAAVRKDLHVYRDEYEALQDQVAALREALRKYGFHTTDCVGRNLLAGFKADGVCICGLDEALASSTDNQRGGDNV